MTTVKRQKAMFYNASLMANLTMLADKVGRNLDFKHLETCGEEELRQLQDNLIEDYNAKLKAEESRKATVLDNLFAEHKQGLA